MPELPEVETTRRGLESALVGVQITRAEVRRRDLRTPIPKPFEKTLKGAVILSVRRRAKYLLIDLDNGQSILCHLGMSGSVRVVHQAGFTPKTHDHVLIYLKNGHMAVFHDPRRFGVMDLVATHATECHLLLKNLGPEPLSNAFSPAYLKAQLLRRKGPLKPVLMDQKLVVGVGNIYASEALHFCGLHPSMPAHKAAPKAADIITAIRTTLEAAIASGGSTLRDYVGADETGGYFQHQFRVYERDGEPCFRCAEMIEIGTHAGRSTYWCPKCQAARATAQKT